MKLLTEPEVAKILRCDPQKIKRLRLAGKLPYLPGRPVLIDEADLIAFIDSCKRRGVGDQRPAVTEAEDKPRSDQAAREWAVNALFRKQQRKPRGAGAKR